MWAAPRTEPSWRAPPGFPQGSNTSARSPAPGRGSASLGGPRTGAGAPITWLVTPLSRWRGQMPAAGTSDVPSQSPAMPGWRRMPYWDAELGCCNGFHTGMLYWDVVDVPGCCTGMPSWDAVLGSILGCHTGMPYWDAALGCPAASQSAQPQSSCLKAGAVAVHPVPH